MNVRRGGVAAGAVIAVLAGAAWVIVRRGKQRDGRISALAARADTSEAMSEALFGLLERACEANGIMLGAPQAGHLRLVGGRIQAS